MAFFNQENIKTLLKYVEDPIFKYNMIEQYISSDQLFQTVISMYIAAFFLYSFYSQTTISWSCSLKQRITYYLNSKTPIHYLAEKDSNSLLEDIISSYKDINEKDNCGKTPLHISAENGNTSFAKLLLKRGAKINVKTDAGKTPLHISAEKGHKNVVDLLLQWKVNVNKYNDRKTALHMCIENGYEEIADVNLVDMDGRTALHIAACLGKENLVELLLKRGAAFNRKDIYGKTALHYCVKYGGKTVLSILLKAGASANIRDNRGRTALHYAAINGHTETVLTLVKVTDFLDTGDNWNRTALHYSSKRGDTKVVKTLLETGAGVDVTDYYGKTPLHYSADANAADVMKVLIQHGANFDIADTSGQTALFVATQKSNDDAVAILKRHGAKVLKQKRNKFMTALSYTKRILIEFILVILAVCLRFSNISLLDSFTLSKCSTHTDDKNQQNFEITGLEVSASEDASEVQKEIDVRNTTPTTRPTTGTKSPRTRTATTYATPTTDTTPTTNTSQTTTPITCITSTQPAWVKTDPSTITTTVFTSTTERTTDATSATQIKTAVETKSYQNYLHPQSTHVALSDYNSRILKNTSDNPNPLHHQVNLTQTQLETFGENCETFFEKHQELLGDSDSGQENTSEITQTNDKQDVMVKHKKTRKLHVNAKLKKRRVTKNNIVKNYTYHCSQMNINKVDYLTTNGNQNFYSGSHVITYG